jgi:DNA topoisomerase-3
MKLYITEKGSQVEALAKALGIKKQGKIAKGKDIIIAPLAGHILTLKKPDEYKNSGIKGVSWNKLVEDGKIPFIPKTFERRVKTKQEGKRVVGGSTTYTDYPQIFADMKSYIEQADEVFLAPDPDNEGVALAMEVVDMCKGASKVQGLVNMNKLDDKSMKEAIKPANIDKDRYKRMYEAAQLRAQYDWSFGMNLTIAATAQLAQGTVLHMGGVKLPTMRMVVERDLAFEGHKANYFYNLEAKVKFNDQEFLIKFNPKFENESDIKALKDVITKGGFLDIKQHSEAIKKKQPPLPMTLTDLQSAASKKYSFKLKKTSDIAQSLYDKKFQSYPRTESNYYSSGFFEDVPDILAELSKNSTYKDIINNKLPPLKKNKSFNDKEVDKTSHTALAPTAEFGSISQDEQKVYDIVAKRFLIQFMELYEFKNINGVVDVKVGDRVIPGKYIENITTNLGWQELERIDSIKYDKDRVIPNLKKGDRVQVISCDIKKVETKPKPRFQDGSLVVGMEKIANIYDDPKIKEHLKESGIGTSATREGIVTELFKQGYFEYAGKSIKSTEKCRKLIDILPEKTTSPINRAVLESQLKEVVTGDLTFTEFEDKIKAFIQEGYDSILLEGKGGPKIVGQLSKKQIEFAKSLAKNNNIELSAKDLKDNSKLASIIKEYANSGGNNGFTISPKIKKIIEDNGDAKIKSYLDKDKLTKEEYQVVNDWVKNFFDNITYRLSEGQLRVLKDDRNKDKLTKTVAKLIEKDYLKPEEYKKVKANLDKIFASFSSPSR